MCFAPKRQKENPPSTSPPFPTKPMANVRMAGNPGTMRSWRGLPYFALTTIMILALNAIPMFNVTFKYPCLSTHAREPNGSHETASLSPRWKVIVTSNGAFERELLNWWYHFRLTGMLQDGNVEVVLYAEDDAIYQKFKDSSKVTVKQAWKANTRFRNVELTQTDKFVIGQPGFNELVSRRPSVLLEELKIGGPNVLYMDLDVLLLRDPRPFFVGGYDFWAGAADNTAQRSANDWVLNSGFLALRPNQANIDTLSAWNKKLQEPAHAGTNQGPFNAVVSQMEREGRVRVKLLAARLFPVGRKFRDAYRKQVQQNVTEIVYPSLDGVVAFHNNFCSSYKTCKIDRFKALDLWVDLDSNELM